MLIFMLFSIQHVNYFCCFMMFISISGFDDDIFSYRDVTLIHFICLA